MSTQLADATYTGDLGGGLIRRWSTRTDQAGIGHLLSHVFRDGPDDPPDPALDTAADPALSSCRRGRETMGAGRAEPTCCRRNHKR